MFSGFRRLSQRSFSFYHIPLERKQQFSINIILYNKTYYDNQNMSSGNKQKNDKKGKAGFVPAN